MPHATTILAYLWIAFWLYWLASAFATKSSGRVIGYGWRFGLVRLLILIVIILVVRLPGPRQFFLHGTLIAPSPILQWSGLLVTLLGLAFAVWARIHLGRNWGMPMSMRQEPELVATGPYALVRHPIYGGFLIAMLGTGAVAVRIWILVLLLCVPYFVYSAFKEEQLMSKEFPEQYPEYKKRTKMFIPYLL